MQTFLSSSSSRPPHELLGAQRPGSPPLALPRGRRAPQRSPRRRPHPALQAGRRLKPMAEAGRRSVEPLGGLAGPAAAEAPEPQEPAPRPATALRRLPGDPSPRGRSQSDLSSCSSRGRPLRVHISGSGKAARGAGDGGRAGRGRWLRDAAGPGRRQEGRGVEGALWRAKLNCSVRFFRSPARGSGPWSGMLQPGCGRCAGWARVSPD